MSRIALVLVGVPSPSRGGKMAAIVDLIRAIPDQDLGNALAPLMVKVASHRRIAGQAGKPADDENLIAENLIAEGCAILRGLIRKHTGAVVTDEQLVPYIQILFRDRA